MINLKQLRKSFAHALRGIGVVYRAEQSFRIQLIVAGLVLALAIAVELSVNKWIVILLLIGSVLTLEMVNSIFERIVDTFKPRIHPAVRDIKDIMAAAVFAVSIVSAIIGLLIFIPEVKDLLAS